VKKGQRKLAQKEGFEIAYIDGSFQHGLLLQAATDRFVILLQGAQVSDEHHSLAPYHPNAI